MKLSKGWILLIVVVGVILLIIAWATGINNNMVTKEEGVNTAWANVENVYQRRLDLIPNLVAAVKGAMGHQVVALVARPEACYESRNIQRRDGGPVGRVRVARPRQLVAVGA